MGGGSFFGHMQIFFEPMNKILPNLQELFCTQMRKITFGGFDLRVTRPQKSGVKGKKFFSTLRSINTFPMVNGTLKVGDNVVQGPVYTPKKTGGDRLHPSGYMAGQTW